MNEQTNIQEVTQPNPVNPSSKNVPTLVKVIAVLHYISAGFSLLGGIFLMISAGLLVSILPILAFFSTFAIFIGIGMIVFAILLFFIARGLWKGQKWARIVAIILYSLGIISSIYSIVLGTYSAISSLLVAGLLGGYLLFSKKVKEAFA